MVVENNRKWFKVEEQNVGENETVKWRIKNTKWLEEKKNKLFARKYKKKMG